VGLEHCAQCPAQVRIHLVNRPADPTDPRGHPVVRVVAPRADTVAADHSAWVARALAELLGP
jgi:hypothetical protein